MNIKHLSLLVALCGSAALTTNAQTISPVPQSQTQTSETFSSTGATYRLTGADNADTQAVAALQNALSCSDSGSIEIVIGEAGDDAVNAYEANIPAQEQGYYLSTSANKVVIAGRDEYGTFYGVQSFLQLAAQSDIPVTEITDYPVNLERGVIEGFYGNPWSFDDRKSQFEFYAANKMNIYVYGPKDDAYHRSLCYEKYPDAEAADMAELVKVAIANKVEFVWAMHPGNDIGSERYETAKEKFQQLYDLGVRRFALFFDDISANSVQSQIDYLNWLDDNFVKAKDDVKSLMVCPTEYCISFAGGWNTTSTYLPTLGAGLHSDIEIMWTGSGVVDTDQKDSCEWFEGKTGRKPFIWLNYPVSDYGGQPLLMGSYPPAATDINEYTTGFCSNPMQYAEASKVALYSIADFTWNPSAFDQYGSWERALAYLEPDHTDAFKTFCQNNTYYYQSTHGLNHPDTETPEFKAIIDTDENISADNAETFLAFFDKQAAAATELLANAENDRLLTEVNEWIVALQLQGKRGRKVIELYNSLQSDNQASFVDLYKEYSALTEEADALISRDYDGSIRSVHPTTGMQYVEPWILAAVNDLIDEFKETGIEYPDGLFPARIIESGQYFILYNGRYLTNAEDSTRPSFTSERDEFTPNIQVWTIKYDSETDRYAIRSAQDNRYINENGVFGTNEYDATWNTYNITPLGGLYAIQNAGNSGKYFWTVKSYRIQQGSNNSWNLNNFLFQIVPVEEEIPETPTGFAEGEYTIQDLEGNLLTRGTSVTFKSPSTTIKTSQIWNLAVDSESNRIKITNRTAYLNEKGVIGTNTYYSDWNSYELYELNGKYAIRNADSAGTNFWYISDSQISNQESELIDSFNFVLEPYGTEEEGAINEISATADGDNTIYDLQGRKVLNPNHGIYIINGKKVSL